MADVSNFKIDERSNVEWPNLRKSQKLEIKIQKLKRQNWFIWNGKMSQFLEPDFGFPNWKKNSINMLLFYIVKLWEFVNFLNFVNISIKQIFFWS